MQNVRRLHESAAVPAGRLVLDYDARTKSRFRARLESGEEIAVRLPRGTVLAHGDRLLADDGRSIEVVAAPEALSVATTSDALLFARAAYHLGNRHVPLQIEAGRLAYGHDHVLDGMLRGLGLRVAFETAPFSPEGGGYAHSHSHEHHSHSHEDHSHEHDHPHAHPDHDSEGRR